MWELIMNPPIMEKSRDMQSHLVLYNGSQAKVTLKKNRVIYKEGEQGRKAEKEVSWRAYTDCTQGIAALR